MSSAKYIRTGDGRWIKNPPAPPFSIRRFLRGLPHFWVAFVIFYAIARIPIGVVIGSLGPKDIEINIGRTMSIPDAIIFFPLNHIWAFIQGHPQQGSEVARIYWILFGIVWSGIILWALFKWIYDTIRTFSEN